MVSKTVKLLGVLVLLVGMCIPAHGQISIFGSATANKIKTGGTLPATCSVGWVFYKTGASAGQYNCSATNTWTLLAAGDATDPTPAITEDTDSVNSSKKVEIGGGGVGGAVKFFGSSSGNASIVVPAAAGSDVVLTTPTTTGTLALASQIAANPVTATDAITDGKMVVGAGGGRGVAGSTITGVVKAVAGVPDLVTGGAKDCVLADGTSAVCTPVVTTTGSGAPSAACAIPATSNLALYWDSTARDLYYCSNATGPVWQQLLTNGAGQGKTGATQWMGVTSGGAGFTVNDVAGTSILYILPAANGSAGQILYDTGATTCPTLKTAPTSCHQLAWLGPGTTTTVLHGNASGAPSFGAVVTGDITDGTIATADVAAILKTRQIKVVLSGTGTGGLLQDTDDVLTDIYYNSLGQGITLTAVSCKTDSATATRIQLQRDDGSPASILTDNTGAGVDCSSTRASGTIDTNEDNIASTQSIKLLIVSAGGAGKEVTVDLTYTLD
jgi:hypothetical protein